MRFKRNIMTKEKTSELWEKAVLECTQCEKVIYVFARLVEKEVHKENKL